MKTKNNVQKTILRSVAVFISFVLISLTVTAQGYWKQLLTNNSFNQIAYALVENPSKGLPVNNPSNNTEGTIREFDYFTEENETSLEIEPWMTNSRSFDFGYYSINEVGESALTLENWMLENDFFKTKTNQESPIGIESWMTNDNLWKI
jgi:hypothetical protein